MKKQLMRWLRRVIIVNLLFVFLTQVFAEQNDPTNAAKNIHSQYREKAGSESSLKKNFINPLLGGDKLYSIDRTQSGDVQLVCPGSKEFLTVLIKPKSTGDFDADIYWDSDLDGRMDKALTVNNISGICANGYISCSPGTWANCQNYSFELQDNLLRIKEIYRTELTGCFCINQSCGSNLVWNNLAYVLKLFSGAVVSAFQTADSRYAISNSQIDGTAIYFYGQRAKDCQTVSGGSGSLYPEQYFKRPAGILSTVENLVFTQSQDPNSYYNMLLNLGQNTPSQLRSCVIKRNVYSDIAYKYKPCSEFTGGTFNFVGGWDANGESKQCYYDRNSCYMLSGHDTSWDICYSRIVNHGNLLYFINSSFLAGTELTAVQIDNIGVSTMGNYSGCFGAADDSYDVWLYVSATCRYLGCQVNEGIDDHCTDLANNNGCSLYNEFVDNVQTIMNGTKTGLVPLKQCLTLCAEGTCSECNQVRCYNWISIRREYICTDQPIDLSSAKRRLQTIVPSVNYKESEGKIIYSDTRLQNNQWITETNLQIIVGGEAVSDSCEKACRVKITDPPTNVGLGDPISLERKEKTTQIYFYRTCQDNTCPVQEGEVVDIECKCMDDFGAASTMLQTLRLAGQDMICTSGNFKTLPGY